tara:strand:+ start:1565 stop:1870 length:306 start_codon:yes stop_codon:yes gene_type:complete
MAATVAAKNKTIRQEALRDFLSNQKLVEKVIDNAKKMEEQAVTMDAQELQGLKYATDTRLKLVAKYLPDLKAMELTGEGGGDIGIDQVLTVEFVTVENKAT